MPPSGHALHLIVFLSPAPCRQVIDFPDADGPLEFSYDVEWLAVLRATHGLLSLQRRAAPLPRSAPPPGADELAKVSWVCSKVRGPLLRGPHGMPTDVLGLVGVA